MSTDQVVPATLTWVAEHLVVDAREVDGAELLTQAAWVLLRAGRRAATARVCLEAWRTTSAPASSELLELSVHLAGVLFSHGELDAASAALPPQMRELLKTAPTGDPDATWSDEIPSWFYVSLLGALVDPGSVVDRFEMTWLNALRAESMSTGYPTKWVLAGALTQLLIQCDNDAGAASVAAVSVHMLDEPADASEALIRAQLTRLSRAYRLQPTGGATERAQALVGDLAAMLIAEPAALDFYGAAALEGLLLVAKFGRGAHLQIADRLHYPEHDGPGEDAEAAPIRAGTHRS